MKKPPLALLIAALSFLLCAFSVPPQSGLQEKPAISIHITSTVESDGSGTFAVEIILANNVMALLKGLPSFPEGKICNEFDLGLEGFSEWTEEERDGSLTCEASKPFADLEGLKAITEQAFDGGSYERLEIKGGRFYYDLAANIDSSLAWETGMPFDIEAWWVVVVPGEVMETNADKTSGRTLTWNLMTMNSASHMRAESKISAGAAELDPTLLAVGAVILLVCCCAVILIAAGAGFFFLRRKNPPSAAA